MEVEWMLSQVMHDKSMTSAWEFINAHVDEDFPETISK